MEKLRVAAQKGDMDTLYALIQEDCHVLERINEAPFVHTPLHTAASCGQTRFAMELMRLNPPYAVKLNPQGFSPLHLALQNGQTQMALYFLDVDSSLVRVKGREGVTPLHFVAEKGNCLLLAAFLHACPGSIEDFTVRGDTALHVAVKNNMFEACEVLVGWLRRNTSGPCWEDRILNWKDEEGNTVLHIAALKNQPQIVRLLTNSSAGWWSRIFSNGVHENSRNLQGLTPLDMVEQQDQVENREVREMLCRSGAKVASALPQPHNLADHYRPSITLREHFMTYTDRLQASMSSDTRNALLVIAALTATASYQSILSPPGGVWQDDYLPLPNDAITSNASIIASPSNECRRPHLAGTAVFSGLENWNLFTNCSALAFCFSTVAVYFLLPRNPLSDLLVISLACLFFCFSISASFVMIPGGYNFSSISLFVIVVLEFVILHIWFHTRAVKGEFLRRLWKYLTSLHRGKAASSVLPAP